MLSEMHHLLLISPTPTWKADYRKETQLLVFSLLRGRRMRKVGRSFSWLAVSLVGQCHPLDFSQSFLSRSLGAQCGLKGSRAWLEIAPCLLAAVVGGRRRGRELSAQPPSASCF